MRRALTLTILGAAAAILVASPVTGHVSKTDTDIFITSAANGVYKGKVVSPSSVCEFGRRVSVWHDSNPDFRIGRAVTDSNGRWIVRGPQPPRGDKVYANTRRKFTRRNADHRHICKASTSRRVVYPK